MDEKEEKYIGLLLFALGITCFISYAFFCDNNLCEGRVLIQTSPLAQATIICLGLLASVLIATKVPIMKIIPILGLLFSIAIFILLIINLVNRQKLGLLFSENVPLSILALTVLTTLIYGMLICNYKCLERPKNPDPDAGQV